ncbi:general substrate transporter [Ustulina deusta]|nr:general substrate transporter [Ustulina deusta]
MDQDQKATDINEAISNEHVEVASPNILSDKIGAADSLGEDIAYGPPGIRGILHSPYVCSAAALASLGGFSFGYDQGVISVILVMDQFLAVFPRAGTAFGSSLVTSLLLLGAFVGVIFLPYVVDRISRKRAIVVCVFIFTVGAVIQTAARNYNTLSAGRFIGGIGTGTLALSAPLYISEIAPSNLRGTLLVLESISIVSGVVIAFWITYGTRFLHSEASFRLPFALQIVPAIILGLSILFFPYSPRWLALVNRNDECLASLAKLRGLPQTDLRVQKEYQGIVTEVEVQRAMQERRHPKKRGLSLEILQWTDLLSRKMWRRTVVGVGVSFFQQFMGINAFIYYAPTLFRELGQSYESSLTLSGVFNVLQLVTVIVCFFIIDKVGRRWLAIVGAVGECVSYVIIAVLSGLYEDNWLDHRAAAWVSIAFAFVFILSFGLSYSPLAWALPTEVFPTSVRSKGVALSNLANWLSNFIIAIITPPLLDAAGFGAYIFFAVFCGGAVLWAIFLLPETMGRTLEEMDVVFGDTSRQEELEVYNMVASASAAPNVDMV